MSESEETKGLRRGIRLDLVVAVCALMISFAATAASWWQSRVVADQLSAQVWPYLSISTTYNPTDVTVEVQNNGLGPAIIRSTVVSIDGKPISNPVDAFRRLLPGMKGKHVGRALSDLGPGDVIRASSSVRLYKISAAWVVRPYGLASKRLDVAICYCSLLGNCWQTGMNQNGDPTPVRRCPDVGPAQYKVPVVST